jgi:cell division transport system permease protein
MAQFGKASSKRGKPSYFMAIVGVSIVLFFIGIFGFLFLSAGNYMRGLKEDVKVIVYLQNNARKPDVDQLRDYIAAKPYTKSIEYVDKEMAKSRMKTDGEENFEEFLEENPLPNSLEFHLKSEFVNKDTLTAIKSELSQKILLVESVKYPAALVEKIANIVKWILAGLIGLAVVFSLLSIILIDNTIRLAMYSNRFLIKTMQMVGATRNFISRPMNMRAVINGVVAAVIAIALIYLLIIGLERFVPYLRDLRNNLHLVMLFGIMLLLGIGISLFSTNRSIGKYLKMKLDDLY